MVNSRAIRRVRFSRKKRRKSKRKSRKRSRKSRRRKPRRKRRGRRRFGLSEAGPGFPGPVSFKSNKNFAYYGTKQPVALPSEWWVPNPGSHGNLVNMGCDGCKTNYQLPAYYTN